MGAEEPFALAMLPSLRVEVSLTRDRPSPQAGGERLIDG